MAWDQVSGPSAADLKSKAARPSHLPAASSSRGPGPTSRWASEALQCPGTPGAPPWLRSSSLRHATPLDELEALGLVVGQAGLEEHRVHAELRVQQGHVAVHLDEEVDALVPLMEVGIVVGQSLRASRTSESPP